MTRTFAAAAAAFATFTCFAITSQASAETARVITSDIDLSSAEGQAKLEKRIAFAARAVCSQKVTGSRMARVDSECVASARASIEKQLAARRGSSVNGG